MRIPLRVTKGAVSFMGSHSLFSKLLTRVTTAAALSVSLILISCGGTGSSSGNGNNNSGGTNNSNSSGTSSADYAAAYKSATWNTSEVTVTFTGSCTMTISSTGAPYQHQTYYLVPANGRTVVATTPSGIQLALSPYSGSGLSTFQAVSATFNICPTKASSPTTAPGGGIGFIGSGSVLFNPDESTGIVALSDNVSYTFTQSGTTYTAWFIDPCNQHTTGGTSGSTWHYHGNPNCWISNVDSATGPSHIIGIALDGYPIYGGRDINGNVVDPSTLDSCNGITSATPEFPSGAYHYVLPIDSSGNAITTSQSSISCFTGTVSSTLTGQMRKLGCKTPMLLASGKYRLPDGREVSRQQADIWMRQMMPGMQMASAPFITIPGNSQSTSIPMHHMLGM